MKLKKILHGINTFVVSKKLLDEEVKDIKIDSRQVEVGDVFIALRGKDQDGNNFIEEAFARGASAIIGECDYKNDRYIKVDNARKIYALACKNFFKKCCDKMKIIGVTGTNGKTTVTSIIYQILQKTRKKVGIIGTFGAKWCENKKFLQTNMTTPDPYMLHKIFYKMFMSGCRYVVMEVSAHALFLDKIYDIRFEVGVLTNITQDHLDYFGDMTSYALAKIKFFEEYEVKHKFVYGENKYCKAYNENSVAKCMTYGLKGCDIVAANIKSDLSGTTFKYVCKNNIFTVSTKLVGKYNVLNIEAAIAVCRAIGVKNYEIVPALKTIKSIAGRFNVIKNGKGYVIIDYAHTPDGLENILKSIKEITSQKVVVIFGCGGDRDKSKRHTMGEIALRLADEVIVTSDNPRTEDPEKIIEDVLSGDNRAIKITSRKEAIEYGIKNFSNGEVILIAGKGAENYQEICGEKIPFNDTNIVKNYIKNSKNDNFFTKKQQIS